MFGWCLVSFTVASATKQAKCPSPPRALPPAAGHRCHATHGSPYHEEGRIYHPPRRRDDLSSPSVQWLLGNHGIQDLELYVADHWHERKQTKRRESKAFLTAPRTVRLLIRTGLPSYHLSSLAQEVLGELSSLLSLSLPGGSQVVALLVVQPKFWFSQLLIVASKKRESKVL